MNHAFYKQEGREINNLVYFLNLIEPAEGRVKTSILGRDDFHIYAHSIYVASDGENGCEIIMFVFMCHNQSLLLAHPFMTPHWANVSRVFSAQ